MNDKRSVGPSIKQVPEGDNRTRLVCPDCGYIEYANPKIVVGAVCMWQENVLLCRRGIEPRLGTWTVPAGFMELGESTTEGAAREVWEEARARIRVGNLIGIYEIPRISQVHMFYHAVMTGPEHAAGEESLDSRLFAWNDIPWDDLAFPSIVWVLQRFQDGGGPWMHPATGVTSRTVL
ncbi:MAG: NUDIX hydrolase [Rhodospirillales bacterium]|nr:NUDIX hydrolase [Rhodospirillales bacterium]